MRLNASGKNAGISKNDYVKGDKKMFEKLRSFFMNIFNLSQVEKVGNVTGAISSEMKAAIELWEKIYTGSADWNSNAGSCGITKIIASSLADPITEEMKIASDNETLENLMRSLHRDAQKIIEYFVSFGGCVLRPVFSSRRVQYEIVRLGNYLPLSYDIDGTLTSAVITKNILCDKKTYLLTEKHCFKNGNHSVESKLYKTDNGAIQKEVPLTETAQTENITPFYEWQNVKMPFIVEFRNNETNIVDSSCVPCALIAGVENLIKDADEEYSRFVWELESGNRKVFADADLFDRRQSKNGKDTVTHLDGNLRKLFVRLNGDGTAQEKITEFSPVLRVNEHIAALNEIFRRIETATNIGKGTISNLTEERQTATQFSGGKKAFYSKVDKYETELEAKYKNCAYVFAYMMSAYTNEPFNPEIRIEYNDMTRKDPKELKQMALQEIASGVMNKWEYRKIFYGEDENEAKANTPSPEIALSPFDFGA